MFGTVMSRCFSRDFLSSGGDIGTWLGVAFIWLISLLPQGLRHPLGFGIGRLAYRYNHKRRSIVETNLRHCFPEKSAQEIDELTREHFRCMGRGFIDYGVFWFGDREALVASVRVDGWEHVEQAQREGKTVIYHVAHCASLEFSGIGIGPREPVTGFYQPLKNQVVNCLITQGRERFGVSLIQRKDGLRGYLKALKAGQSLFNLTDEDMGDKQSTFAPFFAERKATLLITAKLAARGNIAVIPLMVHFDTSKKQYVTRLMPVLEGISGKDENAEQDAQILNEGLEGLIRENPAEYMWTLRLFKTRENGESIYTYRKKR